VSATTQTRTGDRVLAHLGDQIASGRRLYAAILAQGQAIRARDVDVVLARLTDIQTEMTRRGALEQERAVLLEQAGVQLGVPAAAVTLEALTRLMAPAEAEAARERSAELRGLLAEIAREHGLNRALMRQELAFLDHLTRLIGREPEGAYAPAGHGMATGAARPVAAHRVLDLQA
jgi:hypothetical protein